MDTGYYSPSRRNYYASSRGASPEELRSSLRCVKREYVTALDEIEDLKLEKANLKAALNQSFQDKAEEDYRKHTTEMDHASQRLKQSYTQRALIEAEQRVVEVEDENIKLRRLVDSNANRMKKLQEQLVSAHDQVDKLDHLKIFNKHLQTEMNYLDQEFQSIIKRVEDLDEEKTKAKIKKSVSVKYSQDYNQTLLKYVNYIMNTISGLDAPNPIRTRFEELFPISSNILKLVANRDYANLMLKSFKFIADLLPKDADQEQLSPTFSQGISPLLSHTASNAQFFQNNLNTLEISRLSSQLTNSSKANAFQSPNAKKDVSRATITPTSKNRPPSPGIAVPVSSEKSKIISRQDSISSTTNKKLKDSQVSTNFVAKDFKPRLMRSATPNGIRPMGSTTSLRSNQSGAQRNEVLIHDKMVAGQADRRDTSNRRNPSFSAKVEELQDQQVELDLIQRERELIEKERELMERKRELIYKARELQEKEQALQDNEGIQQEEERSAINEPSIENSRTHGYKRAQSNNSYADIRRIRQEEKDRTKSPALLRPILKSSNSQIMAAEQDNLRKSYGGTPGNANRVGSTVKDFSSALREKSKQMSRGGSAYDDEIQVLNVKSEQEASYPRDMRVSKSKERIPISSNKGLIYESELEQLRASKIKSTSSKPAYDDYDESPYNQGESDGSDQRVYHPGSGASTYKSNSYIASYHPTPVESKRKEEREYRREDSGKRVCFDNQNDESMDDEYAQYQQQRSVVNMRQQQEEDYGASVKSGGRVGRIADTPKGTQYASFAVSFGRTESAERSHSPPVKDAGSILDAPMKKRVDHVVQTYDVVKGEDVGKVAIRDNCSPQYKVSAESGLKNKLKRTQTPTPKSTSTSKPSSQKNIA